MTVRIHNPNNRAVGRRVFAFERKARFLSPAPENQFAHTGARSINRNQRLSLWGQILVEGLNDEQLAAPRAVFAAHGNMSSPTVLFIIEHLRTGNAPLPCVALAFGPGLIAEAALIQ
jgi:predicted naringenin-chalcone synthase